MVKFKEYFRNTDVLLIDDIQFMNGKRLCRGVFTLSRTFRKRSQISVSADRPQNKLMRIQEKLNPASLEG